jgi:hypothetical protein
MGVKRPTRRLWRRARALAGVFVAALLVCAAGAVAAGAPAHALPPKPLFQLPFPCGQNWALFSYPGHDPNDKKIDMQRVGGVTNGSPVVASYGGVVHSFGSPGGIEINHGGGWFSLYLHMPTRTVSVGQRVAMGQQIGTVGNVGTKDPHLHYELRYDANGDGDSTNAEIVHASFNGVEYNMGANGERSYNVTSRNCGGDPGRPSAIAGTLGDLDGAGKADLLAMTPDGSLYVYPNTGAPGSTVWGSRILVCTGCGAFDSLTVADFNADRKADLLVRDNGNLYVYPNTGPPGSITWGARYLVCGGCGAFDAVTAGDMNGDGKTDLVVRENGTNIYVYPNTAAAGANPVWGARYLTCGGCGAFDAINVADMNSDGKTDLMVRENGTNIYVYPNTAPTGANPIWGARNLVCSGCAHFDAILAGDLNTDTKTDLLVRDAGNLYVYPNTAPPGATTWGARYLVCSGCGDWRDIN